MPFLFAYGINRFSHNTAYVILVQLYYTVRYNTVLVIIRIKIGPQMTSLDSLYAFYSQSNIVWIAN